MARTKKEKADNERVSDYFDQLLPKVETKPKEPVVTSITINHNGTIFGVADNKIFVYDETTRSWRPR
jgi:hypothetical protein